MRPGLRTLLGPLVSRRGQRMGAVLLAVVGLLAAAQAWQLWRLHGWNTRIAQTLSAPAGRPAAPVASAAAPAASLAASKPASSPVPAEAPDEPPELRFAQAMALAEAGQSDAALNHYGLLADHPALGAAARFNAANLLLRQGQALQAGGQPGQALALIELAKEGYRELLRRHPSHWPARYNLERAQRLLPDPEPAEDSAAAPRQAERAPTTMRGHSPGLP